MVLSCAAPYQSHGCVPVDHGTFQMVLLCPMGHCVLPKVLIFPASHVSHGHIPMDHRTYCVAHGSELSCITFVPWACNNRPWEIANVHPLSHVTLSVAHGPVFCCSISVPWVCSNGPWDISNGPPLSHGILSVAHGPILSCITSVPWACCNGPWTLLLAHGPCSPFVPWDTSPCPWSYMLLPHIHPVGVFKWTMGPFKWSSFVPWDTVCSPRSLLFLDHMCPVGTFQLTMGHTVLPMGLTFPASHLSHGHLPIDHGAYQNVHIPSNGTLLLAHGPTFFRPISV